MTEHQRQQISVINSIEEKVKRNAVDFTTVAPTEDYETDPRLCLTGAHLPSDTLITQVQKVINQLREVEPEYYYYSPASLHITVKNVRVISDPPNFNADDIAKAEKVFADVTSKHKKYNVYFYRLMLFKNNLSLIGTTDPELDEIILDLDQKLKEAGVGDDKKYINDRYFFCNMTLARFPSASEAFAKHIEAISQSILFDPYTVNSISLVSGNAAFKKCRIINTWNLQ